MNASNAKQKIVCVLYDDPVDGYPPKYARDDVPTLTEYPGGQTLPSPSAVDFTPGELLGCVSGELGLRRFLEESGHEFIVTSDKDGPDSVFEKELVDADVVISQPFWPAYLTAERIAKAKNLKLAITAGIGSDHVDLQAAIDNDIAVCEITYSNSISVAEHAVMMILTLGTRLHPPVRLGCERRMEYRGCGGSILRRGSNERWGSRRRTHRACGTPAHEAFRRAAPLQRPAQTAD